MSTVYIWPFFSINKPAFLTDVTSLKGEKRAHGVTIMYACVTSILTLALIDIFEENFIRILYRTYSHQLHTFKITIVSNSRMVNSRNRELIKYNSNRITIARTKVKQVSLSGYGSETRKEFLLRSEKVNTSDVAPLLGHSTTDRTFDNGAGAMMWGKEELAFIVHYNTSNGNGFS
jgi:hypothetical protein